MAIETRKINKIDTKTLTQKNKELKDLEPTWKRIETLIEEKEAEYTGADFFLDLPNEDTAKKEKRKPAFINGFYNPSQSLVSSKGDYILRRKVSRTAKDPDLGKIFTKADQSGQTMDELVRNSVSPALSGYGTTFGVVDKPRGIGKNRKEEIDYLYPYVSVLHNSQPLDWERATDGSLEWFRYWQYSTVKKKGVFDVAQDAKKEYVTWTKREYFRHDESGEELDYFVHGFGVVPVVIQASFLPDARRDCGSSTFFSSSRHIILANNHLSVANVEIFRYGSVLMMSNQDWDPKSRTRPVNPDDNLPDLTSKSSQEAIIGVESMADAPKYLEKDISIVDKANQQALWYFSMAAEAEASGQAPMPLMGGGEGQGQPQSGVSKAYDFKDMDANLFSHAQDLQAWEVQVTEIVAKILKISNPEFSIQYPSDFDVRSFEDKISEIMGLKKAGFPSETAMKVAYKNMVPDLTSDPDQAKTIEGEIEDAVISDPNAKLENPPKISA